MNNWKHEQLDFFRIYSEWGGVVAQRDGRRACDQGVAGLTPGRGTAV